MRFLFPVSSVPVVITVAVLSLWQGNVGATEMADSPEVVTSKSVVAVEGNCDFGNQAEGNNEKALASKPEKQQGHSKRAANNENLFVMFLQVFTLCQVSRHQVKGPMSF